LPTKRAISERTKMTLAVAAPHSADTIQDTGCRPGGRKVTQAATARQASADCRRTERFARSRIPRDTGSPILP
jgi:hypothetical protein